MYFIYGISSYLCTSLHVVDTDFQVGLVIGKGGETIKSMQTRTGARIQVGLPIHCSPISRFLDWARLHVDVKRCSSVIIIDYFLNIAGYTSAFATW